MYAPYAIAAYATKLAIGLKIKKATPAAISTAPSSVVLCVILRLIIFLSVFNLFVSCAAVELIALRSISTYYSI